MKTIQTQPVDRKDKPTSLRNGTRRKKVGNRKTDLKPNIEIAAYFKAQARGFAPGFELDDWLAAEKEVDNEVTIRESSR